MLNQIKNLFSAETTKDTTIVFLGTFVNVIIGGLFFIIAPRILGPANYGLFSVVMATGLMAMNFANFGIDTGILRFLKPDSKVENDKILKMAFKAYVTIGIAVFVIGSALAGPLSSFLGVGEYANLLRIAFFGVIFILLTNFFTAVLQTRKMFVQSSLANICSNTARLFLLIMASYFYTVDLYFLTVLFFTITIVSALVGKLFVPLDFLKAKDDNIQFRNFFGYNFWVAASLAIASIPLDNYILVKTAGPLATGLFAAPLKILSTSYQFAGSFSRVLAPRFSSFDTNTKAIEFSKKTMPIVGLVCAALIASSFLSDIVVSIFLGSQYADSVPVFRVLAIGMAFFFATTIPMAIVLYYFGKSKVAFFITVWHYLIYAVLLFNLVPKQSALGAAYAFTIAEAITFLTLASFVIYKLGKND